MADSLLEVYIERILEEREKRWRAYFDTLDARLEERDRRYAVERNADQLRVDRALEDNDRAKERATLVSNEFRGQLADQAATFLRKEEAQARLNSIEARIDVLSKTIENATGQRTGSATTGDLVGRGISILIALGGFIIAAVVLFKHP